MWRLSSGKPTPWAVTTKGSNDLAVDKTTWWDRLASDITGKRVGDAQKPLAAHLGEGRL